ncbi:hypothetical protein [Leptothrix discophora]|uniref:TIGR03016 family PEP-CTERM system-associated outer membrane protein n=1 Tax=Leptothrix discophora TaxID=89 RepID=A0ABT9FYQ5_LEPDI|nr:hypothetical protein [Leptothrix discophora]MDP4299103.1 hypothetical protein [Leptothrix discophora]
MRGRGRAVVRLLPTAAAVALLMLRAGPVQAAAFSPGPVIGAVDDSTASALEAGVVRTGSEAPAAGGIVWGFAPVRLGGSVSLDLRRQRLEDGRRNTQGLSYAELQWATHVWEPWFIQLRGGFGALVARDVSRQSDGSTTATSHAGTGNVAVSVFPQSRFPFELRADVSDSRVRGDHVGSDYRLRRLIIDQSWRPLNGTDSYAVNVEHSTLETLDGTFSGSTDRVDSLRAQALLQRDVHRFEWSGQLSRNLRSDSEDRSRYANLSARHAWQPLGEVQVDTLATWNEVRLHAGLLANRQDTETDIRQIASFASWRPLLARGEDGTGLSPLQVTGSLRLVEADTGIRSLNAGLGSSSRSGLRAANVALGLTRELTPSWRLSGGVSGTRIETAVSSASGAAATLATPDTSSTVQTGNVTLGWAPVGVLLGGSTGDGAGAGVGVGAGAGAWRYTPGASASLGASRSSGVVATPSGNAPSSRRLTQGAQFNHGLGRDWLGEDGGSLSVQLGQSLGALHDSQSRSTVRALAHTLGLYWQGGLSGEGSTASYGYASASYSDSRTLAGAGAGAGTAGVSNGAGGRFQLVNVQLSRRTGLSRHSSWSGNLTAQGSRSDTTQIDVFTGQVRLGGPGWLPFYSGSLSYEHLRVADVPRLRYTATLTVNSQSFESRAAGDIDALRERVTESIENRLDYTVGQLELRLLARAARVDGRPVSLIGARALRRF